MYLCCKNHDHLRWHTKALAWDPKYGYTGARNIFYFGAYDRHEAGGKYEPECACPAASLRRVPEIRGAHAIYTTEQIALAWRMFEECYNKWEATRDSAYWLVAQKLLLRRDQMIAANVARGYKPEGYYAY